MTVYKCLVERRCVQLSAVCVCVCVGPRVGVCVGWGEVQLPAGVGALPTSVPTLTVNNKRFAFFFLSPFPRDERIWLTSRWRYIQ